MAKKSLLLGLGIALLTFGASVAGCGDDDDGGNINYFLGNLSIEPETLEMNYEQSPKSVKLTYLDDNNQPLAGAKIYVSQDGHDIVMGKDKDGAILLDDNGQATIKVFYEEDDFLDNRSFNDEISLKAYLERPGEQWENKVTLKVNCLSGYLIIVSDTITAEDPAYNELDPETIDYQGGNHEISYSNKYADSPAEEKMLLSLLDTTNNKDVGDILQGRTIDFEIDDERCYLTTADNVKKQKGQITLNQHSSALVTLGYTAHEDFTCTYHFSYTLSTVSGTKAEYNYQIKSHSENHP